MQVCRSVYMQPSNLGTDSVKKEAASASCQCQRPIDCYYYCCQASKRIESTMASHPNQAIRAPAAAAS